VEEKKETEKQSPTGVASATTESEEQEKKSIPDRIMEHFEKHPEPQNIEEIADAIEAEVTSALKLALRRLVEKESLKNPQRGIYCNKDFKVT
jgi:NAD-dependent oxidoreductase involved in siderophore biosynthesis